MFASYVVFVMLPNTLNNNYDMRKIIFMNLSMYVDQCLRRSVRMRLFACAYACIVYVSLGMII